MNHNDTYVSLGRFQYALMRLLSEKMAISRNWGAFSLAIVTCAFATGCTSIAAKHPYGISPQRLAQVNRICTDTMKLVAHTVQFEDCVETLSETVKSIDPPAGAD